MNYFSVESLTINDTKEESAFKEANNATGTPAVRQFNCLPQAFASETSGSAATPLATAEESAGQDKVRHVLGILAEK